MLGLLMVIVLIVVGVIAFLAVDAYILYRVFAGRRSAGDYATLPVPGETELALHAGRVKLSYQESYKAGSTGDSIDFGVPGQLEVTVASPAGETLEIKGPGFRGMGVEPRHRQRLEPGAGRDDRGRRSGSPRDHRPGRHSGRNRAADPGRQVDARARRVLSPIWCHHPCAPKPVSAGAVLAPALAGQAAKSP
jgi:hypothetical protein